MANGQERGHHQEEAKIPVFSVVKNGAVLKNIFVISNKHRPEPHDAGEETLVVGRHPSCDVVLLHPSVSRLHLQINTDPSAQKLFVTDLSSVHGTWVSENRIEPGCRVEMSAGDSIRVGGSTRVYTLHWVPLSRAYDADDPFVPESDLAMAEEDGEECAEIDQGNGVEGSQKKSLLAVDIECLEGKSTLEGMSHEEHEEGDKGEAYKGKGGGKTEEAEENQEKNLLAPEIECFLERSIIAAAVRQEEEKEEDQDKNLLAPEIERFVERSILAAMRHEEDKKQNQEQYSDTAGCRELQCLDSVLESLNSLFINEISGFDFKNELPSAPSIPESTAIASSVEEVMEIPSKNSLCRRHVLTPDNSGEVTPEASSPAVDGPFDQSVGGEFPEGEMVPCPMARLECKSKAGVTSHLLVSSDEVDIHLATNPIEKAKMDIHLATNPTEKIKTKGFLTKDPATVNWIPGTDSMDLISYDGDTIRDNINEGNGFTECSLPIQPDCREKEENLTEDGGSNKLLFGASAACYPVDNIALEQVANHLPSEESAKQSAEGSHKVALLATEVMDLSLLAVTSDLLVSSDEVDIHLATNPTEKAKAEGFLTKDNGRMVNCIPGTDFKNLISYDRDTSSDNINEGNGFTECSLLTQPDCSEKEENLTEDTGSDKLLLGASATCYPVDNIVLEQVANHFPSEESAAVYEIALEQLANHLPSEESAEQSAEGSHKVALLATEVMDSSLPAVTSELLVSSDEVDFHLATNSTEKAKAERFLTKDTGRMVNCIPGTDSKDLISYDSDTSNGNINEGNEFTEYSVLIQPHSSEKEQNLTEERGSDKLLFGAGAAYYPVDNIEPEQIANHLPSEESSEQSAEESHKVALLATEVMDSSLPAVTSELLVSSDKVVIHLATNPTETTKTKGFLTKDPGQIVNSILGTDFMDLISYDGDTDSDNINERNGFTECSLLIQPDCRGKEENLTEDGGSNKLLFGARAACYPVDNIELEQAANHLPSEESAEQSADGNHKVALLATEVMDSSLPAVTSELLDSSDEVDIHLSTNPTEKTKTKGFLTKDPGWIANSILRTDSMDLISYDGDTSREDINEGNGFTECSLLIQSDCRGKEDKLTQDGAFNKLLFSASAANYPVDIIDLEQVVNHLPSEESAESEEGSHKVALLATEVVVSSLPAGQFVSEIINTKESLTPQSNVYSHLERLENSERPYVATEEKLGNCSISSRSIELFPSTPGCTSSTGRMFKEDESDREANYGSQWEADHRSSIPFAETEAVERENLMLEEEKNCIHNNLMVESVRKQGKLEAVRDVTPCRSSPSKVGSSPYQEVIASWGKENHTPGAVRKRKSKGETLVSQTRDKENRLGRVPLQPLNVNPKVLDASFSANTTSNSSSINCSQSLGANLDGKSLPEAPFSIAAANGSGFVDCSMQKENKFDLAGERRSWTMVTDTTTLVDKESRKSLQLLQGLKETRLIIPETVLEELACLKQRGSFFGSRKTDASLALEWIEKCTAESQWWIHLQKTVDDDLIDCVLQYKRRSSDEQLVLLSNNTDIKTKAMTEGLICETAQGFRDTLVNPFSGRFLWAASSPRGRTWSVLDDVVLKEQFYKTTSEKSERRECPKGLKVILLPSCPTT